MEGFVDKDAYHHLPNTIVPRIREALANDTGVMKKGSAYFAKSEQAVAFRKIFEQEHNETNIISHLKDQAKIGLCCVTKSLGSTIELSESKPRQRLAKLFVYSKLQSVQKCYWYYDDADRNETIWTNKEIADSCYESRIFDNLIDFFVDRGATSFAYLYEKEEADEWQQIFYETCGYAKKRKDSMHTKRNKKKSTRSLMSG